MIKLYESVPYAPTIRASTYYDGNWLYVYRYEKSDRDEVISRMMKESKKMADNGYYFGYINPSWGWRTWCCVTVVSYWASIGVGHEWKMGKSDQGYIWSPRYGGDYDKFLLDLGFTKYNYNLIGLSGLRSGDIIQSWSHVAMAELIEEGLTMDKMPTLKKGSKGNTVKNLQVLLNYWMCQSGEIRPLFVDGDFGSLTEERVKEYQKSRLAQGSNYITVVDGIVGTQTWSDLLLT